MEETIEKTAPEPSHDEGIELALTLFKEFSTNGFADGMTRGEFGSKVLAELIRTKWKPSLSRRKGQSLKMQRVRRADSIRRRLSDLIAENDGPLVVSGKRRDKQTIIQLKSQI